MKPVVYGGARSKLAWRVLVAVLSLALGFGVVNLTLPLLLGTINGSPLEFTEPPVDNSLPGRAVPILDSPHIAVGERGKVPYNSIPPTSGVHYPVTPALGVYQAPMLEELQVHALEHGHIGVQYAADTPAGAVRALEKLAGQFPDDVFVAPYPKLQHGIALTAWGRIDTFTTFDEGRVITFIHALAGRYNHGWVTGPRRL